MSKFLRIAVSTLLLAYLAYRTDWAQMAHAFANLKWGYWAGAVAILCLTQVVSAWRWQMLAGALGLARTVAQMTGYYFIGMFFNLMLPTSVGGDVVRVFYVTGTGRRMSAFVSVLVDRLNGLAVLLALACTAAAVQFHQLPLWVCLFTWCTTLGIAAGVVLLPRLAHLGQHGQARVEQMRVMLQLLRQPRLIVRTTLLSVVVQVANIVLVWQVGLALGLNISFAYYWILVPMVTVVTLLPISVNGMGVREGAMFLLLQPLGVSQTDAVTLSLLWLAVTMCTSLFGGLAYLSGRFSRVPKLSAQEPDHGSVDHHPHQGRTRQLDQAA